MIKSHSRAYKSISNLHEANEKKAETEQWQQQQWKQQQLQ